MLTFLTDHWVGILLATLAAMVIGGVWYAKPVFGAQWQKLVGLKDKDMKTGVAKAYIVMIIVALVTAVVLQRFLVIANPLNYMEAVKLGLWIWLGFVATYGIGGGVFEHRPGKLIAINLGNQLVTLVAMAAILYALM